jgi:hypothetical protein
MDISVTVVRNEYREGIDVEGEILGSRALIHINEVNVEICLSDWYGRQSHNEALRGIDDLIKLLTEAKTQIEMHKAAMPPADTELKQNPFLPASEK